MGKDTPTNPYLDAVREWNERYGSYVSMARFARNIAYITTFIALTALVGLIWVAGQKEVKPYIVEIDKAGEINVHPVGKIDQRIKNRIVKAQLNSFVEKYRAVVLDAQIQRDNILDIYRYLQPNTPAFTKITQFYKKNDPFKRAKKETVFAKITRIMPLKNNAWQIEWRETVMERKTGQVLKIDNYKTIAYITISPPTDEAAIIKNPLGMIISDLNWSKEI